MKSNSPETMTAQTDAAASDARSLEASVGAQVKQLRQTYRLTIAELAKATKLSVGMVSKIENGQTSPSLTTLQALAQALNVPISAFFHAFEEQRDATYVRSGQGLNIDRRGTRAGHLYQLLGHSLRSNVQVEPYLISLDKDAEPHSSFQHPGHEFIYMLEGEVTYRHGDRLYQLTPGDSLFFDAVALHGPEILTKLPAQYLSIIVSPEASDAVS